MAISARSTGGSVWRPAVAETNFIHFQPDYIWSARNYWNSPYHTSESALAWLATRLAGATHEGAAFDIRWLGAVHAALCLAAFGILLAALRGMSWRAQAATAIVTLLVFTDVCYTAYLNSFYMDAAALVGPTVDGRLGRMDRVDQAPSRAAPLCVFTLAALLFVTSKSQHAPWMALPAAFLIARGIQSGTCLPACRRARILAWSGAALVLLSGAAILSSTDASYRGQAMFNVLFFRLGPGRRQSAVARREARRIALSRHARVHARGARRRSRVDRRVRQSHRLRPVVQVVRATSPEHTPISGRDPEGGRSGNAAGESGEFSRTGKSSARSADGTVRRVEQLA